MTRLAVAFAVAGVLVAQVAYAETQAELAEKENEDGKALMFQGNFKGATEKFRDAADRAPEAKYFFNLCYSVYQQGIFGEALTACNNADKLNPDDTLKGKLSKLEDQIKTDAAAQHVDLQPGLRAAGQLWNRTELRPAEVDVAALYDGFSILTMLWLEALGFCPAGQSGAFVEGGKRIGLGGELPLNTQGGQLSGGRLHGLGFVHEACLQLRGQAGARQVGSARVAVVAVGALPYVGCLLLRAGT